MRITIDYDLTPEQEDKLARIGENRGRSGRSPETLKQTFFDVVGWLVSPDAVEDWIDMQADMVDFGQIDLDFGDLDGL